MSPGAKRFIDSLGLPAGHHLSETQEQLIGEAFDRWQRQDLVERMIAMKPRRAGKVAHE